MKFLLVGADPNNSTDGFIVLGVRKLLTEAFPGFLSEYLFLDDHTPQIPQKTQSFDAIVLCGTPWLWDRFYRSEKWRNLKRILAAHPQAKRVFLGLGSCFDLDKMELDLCEDPRSQQEMREMWNQGLCITRDSLIQKKFEKAGVHSTRLPCPAFFSTSLAAVSPQARPLLVWADPTATISGGYWQSHPDDFFKMMDEDVMRFVAEAQPLIVKAFQNEPNYLTIDDDKERTIPVTTTRSAIYTMMAHNPIKSMRVHWAIPALAMGRDVSIVPLDSRHLAFSEFKDIDSTEPFRREYIKLLRDHLEV